MATSISEFHYTQSYANRTFDSVIDFGYDILFNRGQALMDYRKMPYYYNIIVKNEMSEKRMFHYNKIAYKLLAFTVCNLLFFILTHTYASPAWCDIKVIDISPTMRVRLGDGGLSEDKIKLWADYLDNNIDSNSVKPDLFDNGAVLEVKHDNPPRMMMVYCDMNGIYSVSFYFFILKGTIKLDANGNKFSNTAINFTYHTKNKQPIRDKWYLSGTYAQAKSGYGFYIIPVNSFEEKFSKILKKKAEQFVQTIKSDKILNVQIDLGFQTQLETWFDISDIEQGLKILCNPSRKLPNKK
jgi:hypothetical protein